MNKLLIGIFLILVILIISCTKDNNQTNDDKNSSGLRGGERYSFVVFIIEIMMFINNRKYLINKFFRL